MAVRTLLLALVLAGCGRLGYDAHARRGEGVDGSVDAPVPDGGMPVTGFTRIEAGELHTCGIYRGRAYCWGDNADGALGDGTTTSRDVPVAVIGLPDADVSDISAGRGHTCAVVSGNAYCWGAGSSGQLGDGAMRPSTTPVAVLGLPDGLVDAISAGDSFTCALADGEGYCWGDNGSGRLGDGTTTQRLTAVALAGPGLSAALHDLSAGQDHACLVDGTQGYCWGHNDYGGALGSGMAITMSEVPVEVVGLALADVSIAGWHGCGVDTAGAVHCWGRGDEGILGDGMNTDSPVPVAVSGLSDGVTQVETGGGPTPSDASCAVRGGRVHCWGNNQRGRLGVEPIDVSRDVPAEVPGITGAISVTVGWWHACALLSNATVVCWGRNSEGQLGNGETLDSTAPVAVRTP